MINWTFSKFLLSALFLWGIVAKMNGATKKVIIGNGSFSHTLFFPPHTPFLMLRHSPQVRPERIVISRGYTVRKSLQNIGTPEKKTTLDRLLRLSLKKFKSCSNARNQLQGCFFTIETPLISSMQFGTPFTLPPVPPPYTSPLTPRLCAIYP